LVGRIGSTFSVLSWSIRTAESIFDGRTIPVGMRGTVLEARPDGSCLAEFAFAPQTVESDGDFVQGILARDQYEIIET
jgi:hypothetical protein